VPAAGARRVLLATRSRGKAAELRAALGALGWRVTDLVDARIEPSPQEDAVEAFDTFEANALAKARFFAAAAGGLPTIADDSGLEVDALGGGPGVRSRRWAGVEGPEGDVTRANNVRLLEVLAGAPSRTARFVCAIAFVSADATIVERGETHGRIATVARGDEGFGYDPLFESADLGWRTFGEAARAEKATVSHRGRAIARLAQRLAALGTPGAG
jgi:XTP/dITP diphosphohydrolase